jgi:GDP-D-mannose dehydratase
MATNCALITGITGQDGAYLAEFLLEYTVLDVSRLFELGWLARGKGTSR